MGSGAKGITKEFTTTYQAAVGAILHVATSTRPDVAHAYHVVSRFNQEPNERAWNIVKDIIAYLKYTCGIRLTYQRKKASEIAGWTDSDFAESRDRSSISCAVFTFCGGAVSWHVCKQSKVARNTQEAEANASFEAMREGLWLVKLVADFGMQQSKVTVHSDNQELLACTHKWAEHARTKHFDIELAKVHQVHNEGPVNFEFTPLEDMIADGLTKPIPSATLVKHNAAMGLFPPSVG